MTRTNASTKTPHPVSFPAPPSSRVPLDRERIARAALALIDRDGLEGWSMRRLGQELGVEAMALYHHFKSKGELLDAVLELLASEICIPDPASGSVIDRIRLSVRSYRQVAVVHPRAFILLGARRFNTRRAFDIYEQILKMYAECGLAPREQAYWFRLLGGFANGAGMAYVASIEHIPDATKLQLQHAPEAIPFPHVSAAAPFLRIEGLEAAFEFGLDVLLETLARGVSTVPPKQGGSVAIVEAYRAKPGTG
jgi:AcrR family transcriptional regulator